MKKILLLLAALTATVFGAEAETAAKVATADVTIASAAIIAAVIGVGLGALGGAIGMGNTAAATIAGTARNPGLGGKLMTTMFIALAMIEAQVIYAMVFGFIALYANPFLG